MVRGVAGVTSGRFHGGGDRLVDVLEASSCPSRRVATANKISMFPGACASRPGGWSAHDRHPPSAVKWSEATLVPAGGAQRSKRPASLPQACAGTLGGPRTRGDPEWPTRGAPCVPFGVDNYPGGILIVGGRMW